MSVVEVDERGRMTIPRKIGLRKAKATVIAAGSFFVVVPIRGEPHEYAGGWFQTGGTREELKERAERAASKDAVRRAKRRRQL